MTIQGLAKRYRNEFAWDRYERIASVNKEKKYITHSITTTQKFDRKNN